MATGNVIVTVVDVGQGQCTFVEIYDTASPTPKLTHALLFDNGSDHQSTQTQTNLQAIADIVSTMDTPAFDCVVFSHSDKDHISLMKDLLLKFKSDKKPVVKLVWYGGDYDLYTKNSFNILNYLIKENYCKKEDINSTGSNYSSYDSESKTYTKPPFWSSPDDAVKVYALISNVLSDDPDWDDQTLNVKGKTAEAKNRVSIICGLYYAGASYVMCGDATNVSMAAMNKRFAGSSAVFQNNVMLTLPHHGSRATGFAVKSGESASLKAMMIVSGFSGILNSKTLTVSAYQKHRHPSLYLMTSFIPIVKTPILRDTRLKQKNTHRLTANIDYGLMISYPETKNIPQQTDLSFETLTNTFSTNYNVGTKTFAYDLDHLFAEDSQGTDPTDTVINSFACWRYTTATNGSFTLGGYSNISSTANLFTAPALTLMEAEALGVSKAELKEPPSTSVRTKFSTIRDPAGNRPRYHYRLKQFR